MLAPNLLAVVVVVPASLLSCSLQLQFWGEESCLRNIMVGQV